MNIITAKNITTQFIAELFHETKLLSCGFKNICKESPLKGKVLMNLFFQPSTRTYVSFSSAMQKLGGGVVSIESPTETLALKRGESFWDTMKTIERLCDVLVWRDDSEERIKEVARIAAIPVINAGNGRDEHPTQSLIDLYTIKETLGRDNDFSCLFVGDLSSGRTIHSLLILFSQLSNVNVYLCSPKPLALPENYAQYLKQRGLQFSYVSDADPPLSNVDIIYLNRMKKEMFHSEAEYRSVENFFILDQEKLRKLNKHAIIMHPLPRTHELPSAIDADSRTVYFDQVQNGLYIRMALLKKLLL